MPCWTAAHAPTATGVSENTAPVSAGVASDRYYFVAKAPNGALVGQFTLPNIVMRLRSREISPDFVATESSGKSYSDLVRQGGANWTAIKDLVFTEFISDPAKTSMAVPTATMMPQGPMIPQYATPYAPPKPPDEMSGVDWVVVVLCPTAGCIIGIIRCIQGKRTGPIMVGASILAALIFAVIRAAMIASH